MKKVILFLLFGVVLFGQPFPPSHFIIDQITGQLILQDTTLVLGFGKDVTEYGYRQSSGTMQYRDRGGSWLSFPTSLTGGGWTLGLNKVYPTTFSNTVHLRKYSAGDTARTSMLNVYGQATIDSIYGSESSGGNLFLRSTKSAVHGKIYLDSLASYFDGTTKQLTVLGGLTGWGEPNGGYQFDGVDDFIAVSDNDNFSSTQKTIEVVFSSSSIGTTQNLITKQDTQYEYLVAITSSKAYLKVFSAGGSSASYNYTLNVTLTSNKTYHLVVVQNDATPTSCVFYLNGVPYTVAGVQDGVYVAMSNTTASFRIGSRNLTVTNPLIGKVNVNRLYNRVLTQAEVTALYNNGRPDLAQLPYADRGASQSTVSGYDATGGDNLLNDTVSVSYGKMYKFTKGSSDSCSINGVKNIVISGTDTTFTQTSASSLIFYAMGDLTGSNFQQVGCVAEYLGTNAGRLGWIESSGNQLSGATLGSPISLNAEQRPMQYRDVKKSVDSSVTTLTSVIPKGYVIREIRVKGSTSETGINIGTSSRGAQVVSGGTASTTASLLTLAATANAGYSETADQTLYVDFDNAAGTIDLIFKLEKVGN